MATRVYHVDSGGSDTSTASATVWEVHRTLTFTPDSAGGTYLLLGYCESVAGVSNARDTQVQLYDVTAAAQLMLTNIEAQSTADTEYHPCTFMHVVTFGASAPSQTYTLEHKLESTATSTTSRSRNGSLIALKLDAADAWMQNDGTGGSTANPGAWTDYNAVSGDDALIFTPASTGDYLILATCQMTYSATTNGAVLHLLCEDGTTEVGTQAWCPPDSTTRYSYGTATKRSSLGTSSQTFKFRHARQTSGSGTSTLRAVRMVALRLDGFEGNTATEDVGADTTTSATYVDLGDTRTDTLTSGIDYLLLATGSAEVDTAGVEGYVKVTDGTNTYAEAVLKPSVAARGNSFLVPKIVTGAGASVTHKFQGHSDGTNTLSLDEHRLFVVQVEAAAGGGATASPATVGLVMAQPAAAAQAGSSVAPATAAAVLAQPAATSTAGSSTAPATAALVLAQPAVTTSSGGAPTITWGTIEADTNFGTEAFPMPASISAGDLLLAFIASDSNVSPTTPTDWTVISQTTVGSNCQLYIIGRIAAGSDTLTINGNHFGDYVGVVGCIPAAEHGVTTVATDVYVGTAATATSTTPDPPTVSPSPGAAAYLAIAACAVDMTTGDSISAVPSTYTQVSITKSADSTSSVGLGVATKALTSASSEDPGGFTSTSAPWTAQTLMVPPASGASATASPTAAALVVAQPAVSASAGSSASPATAALVLAQPAVSATGGATGTASPATAALTVAQPAVTPSAGAAVSPAAAALLLAQPAVTARAGASVAPATAALTLAQPEVTETAGSTVAPATVALVLTQPAVTARAGATVSPATVTITVVYPAVTATSDSAGAVTVHEYTTAEPVFHTRQARPVYAASKAGEVMSASNARSVAA